MFTADPMTHAVAARSGRLIMLLYVAAGLATVLPILLVDIPPLVDYPNHLARIHVLADYDTSPLLQQNYLIEWRWIPNLAMDGVATLLSFFFSPMEVGRAFLALTVLSTAGGIVALHKVLFGRIGLWPLASFGIAYSLPFAWGLVNFQFSIGLCLLCCAAWIMSEHWHSAIRIITFSAAASLVYFAHLFGYAALVFVIALYELNGAFRQPGPLATALFRRAAIAGASFALPTILLLTALLDRENSLEPLMLGTWYGDAFSKLSALLSAFLFYGGVTDISLAGVVLALVIVAILTGRCVVARPLAWPLAGLLVLTLAAPSVLRGLFLDARVGFTLGCFFIAAVKPVISRPLPHAALHLALIVVLVVKFGMVSQIWDARNREYASFRAASQAIGPGSRLLAVHDNGDTKIDLSHSVRWYMAVPIFPALSETLAWRNIDALAVIDRQVYSPTLFKNPSSQPLRSSLLNRDIDSVAPARRVTVGLFLAGAEPEAAEKLRRRAAENGEIAFWADWPQRFDYVVVIRYPGIDPTPLDGLPIIPLTSGSFFDIYRVAHAG